MNKLPNPDIPVSELLTQLSTDELVEHCAFYGLTLDETATFMKVHVDEVVRDYVKNYEAGKVASKLLASGLAYQKAVETGYPQSIKLFWQFSQGESVEDTERKYQKGKKQVQQEKAEDAAENKFVAAAAPRLKQVK